MASPVNITFQQLKQERLVEKEMQETNNIPNDLLAMHEHSCDA